MNKILSRLYDRGYPTTLVHKVLTEVQFSDRTGFRNVTKRRTMTNCPLSLVGASHKL